MAAGHRPCAYCRRPAYNSFRDAWGSDQKAPEIDAILHKARAIPGARALHSHQADAKTLPAGAFINAGGFALLTQDAMLPYSAQGYGAPIKRPIGTVTVLTSQPMVDILRCGYVPTIHPTAQTPLFT